MGAKDWMLFYASDDVSKVLRSSPKIDREATTALMQRLYPSHNLRPIPDGCLDVANPPAGEVYAGVFPGLSIVCTRDAANDAPTDLDPRFVREAAGRTLYLHAMHSVVDFFAYAIWEPDGTVRRAFSLAPDSGVIEDIGTPLPFEEKYLAGDPEFLASLDGDDYPFRFHPLDLAEEALRSLFGFNYEGLYLDDDPNLEEIVLAGYAVTPR
ncbi:DUF6928 family protein [Lentzea flava]|uniref:Uncharacterized protein n=1 Tax=Lentzea flava TaxID=103732 RepID=A0ABQ2VAI7_9PSEU|nr:hypothetical protein [Lentzea flava]MCP2204102.1 hypothetical protein [Lentzea flava]GGU74152.1 hypothetical protein GCM10010178_76950 [Lentzea flava]